MFDLTSSKLLILGVVALIVVGPKELPFLLRTIGKYVGMMRRHANEFRAQFDEAMREAELASIKEDLERVARDATSTIRDAGSTVEKEMHAASHDVEHSIHVPVAETKSAETSSSEIKLSEPAHTFDALNGLEANGHAPEPVTSDESPHIAAKPDQAPGLAPEPVLAPKVAPELAPAFAKTGS